MRKILLLLTTLALSGCLLETVGPIDRSIKPYGAHGVKEGMTRESRRVDSWACGAANTVIAADSPLFPDSVMEMERMQSEQNVFGPRARLLERWSVCMRSKGYQFVGIGNCDERCLYP